MQNQVYEKMYKIFLQIYFFKNEIKIYSMWLLKICKSGIIRWGAAS